MEPRCTLKTAFYTQDDREVEKLFNKKFRFYGEWLLPEVIFSTHIINSEKLLNMKKELNAVKSQLNDLPLEQWSKFTKFRDPSGSVIRSLKQYQPEILTQAWCKFYEILSQFQMLPNNVLFPPNETLQTLHLCEAPGGFISALNHYLAKKYPELKWEWTGFTLNPYHEGLSLSEMIPDDRLIRFTDNNWNFGIDNTGDITQYHNHVSLVNDLKEKRIGLITADGSIDCMFKPEEQESIVHFIHYCEIITALSVLTEGGSFVIKMFTMFEQPTISLVYLLNCAFNEVIVYKPCTSKHGNSEVYILCRSYKGIDYLKIIWPSLLKAYEKPNDFADLALFSWTDMGLEYLEQIEHLCEYFMDMQIRTINHNFSNFSKSCRPTKIIKIKNMVADYFLNNCGVIKIENDRKLINPSYFEEVPETARFCFHNRFWRYKPDWCFNKNFVIMTNVNVKTDNLLSLKLGKAVTKVLYSPYYSCQHFSEFNFEKFRKRSDGNLYKLSEKLIHSNGNLVLSMNDFPKAQNNSAFQKNFFNCLFNKIDEINNYLIFVQVPFVTNFVVGLLFILSLGFNKIVFVQGGSVILMEPTKEGIKTVKKILNIINYIYECMDKYCYFKFTVDILQLISPLILEKNEFYKCIWNYNNSLCNLYLDRVRNIDK